MQYYRPFRVNIEVCAMIEHNFERVNFFCNIEHASDTKIQRYVSTGKQNIAHFVILCNIIDRLY